MKTPTSVMVLSIIGIILGGLGILGTIWAGVVLFVKIGPPNPMIDALHNDTLYIVYSVTSLSISFPCTLLLIFASIASLSLKKWARRGMIFYAWFAVVHCIIGTIFSAAYVVPKMVAAMPAGSAGSIGLTSGLVGGACGLLLGLAFPICVIFFFTRPRIIDAFNGIFPASPTAFPVLFPNQPPEDSSRFP